MRYLSVAEIAKKWDVSERSVRNYCAQGRVNGAFLTGKTWNIPENAEKPERTNKRKEEPITLLDILKEQKASKYSGGIYHKTQIDLTYNSNHMEGSRLTHDQTRYIFETNTIGVEKEVLNVDDVIETANHFRCIDMIIDHAKAALTEKFIKELHLVLKNGTSDSRKDWFAVGEYKKLPNEVGGRDTALPEEVADKMKALLTEYNAKEEKTFEDILDFHVKFERIHPFQDGNGRVGRLIMFKECLKYNIVPFIIEDNLKMFYYRGLKEWDNEKGYLTDICLTAQDKLESVFGLFQDWVHATTKFLEMFFSNLILGTEYELKNRYMHVDYVDDNSQSVIPKVPKSQFDTLECTLEELAVLRLIYKNPSIKQKELAAETGKSLSTVKRIMESLQKKDYIRRVDGKRYGKWEVLI